MHATPYVSKIIHLEIGDTESCNSPFYFAQQLYWLGLNGHREGVIAILLWFYGCL